ncbi:MAG: hypothetical protein EXR72_10685 [Myxococcales bacterium]|nr:hypothetical protein [Myxococcales bacterium]
MSNLRRSLLLSGALAACNANVTPPAGVATCTLSVTPPNGGLTTVFTATLASMNAATCTWTLDGKRTLPVACTGTFTATGAQNGDVGTHMLLVTATGAAGVGTCSASWTVLPTVVDLSGAPPPDLAMGMPPGPDMAMMGMPPDPDMAKAPKTLDLHQATLYNNPMNLADWPEATTITQLEFRGDGVHLEFSKREGPGSWPDIVPPGWDGPLQYTLGMAEFINGKWHASAAIQFWRSLDASGGNVALNDQVAKNWYYDGRWGALEGRQPKTGEIIGIFVVAGNARGVMDNGSQSPVHERSNVVLVPMPDANGAKHTF